MTACGARVGHSQFACHDHLGFVGVDRAAFLEEVDGGLVGIYKQQTLSKYVKVDKFACNMPPGRQRISRQNPTWHTASMPARQKEKKKCSPNCCAHFWAGNHSPVSVMSLRFPMMGRPLGPGGRARRREFCWRPRQTQYAAKRAASQTKADIPESSHGSKARTPKIIDVRGGGGEEDTRQRRRGVKETGKGVGEMGGAIRDRGVRRGRIYALGLTSDL